jgi:hypothetical protein
MLLALVGCQSFTSASSYARVRVIDLASDVPAVDIYHGTNAVAYNLSFGTVTSYVPVLPGTYALTVDAAGAKQVLSTLKGTLTAGGQYTMLINGTAANLQQALLTDLQEQPGPAIRFIHQAPLAGPVDVYVVPTGQRLSATTPIVTSLSDGVATTYLPVPLGNSAIVLLPAGTTPSAAAAIHSGKQTHYASRVARTLILIDGQPSSASSVQVITATDSDPTQQ